MSSVGQAVGMVVGGVIGFFAGGNVMLGASIGGAIGGAIDPPKGPDTKGPRLDDLSLQTSTYGASKNRAYGTMAIVGNIFWLEGDKYTEHEKKEDSGGKGGGGATYTSYTYSATFAVALTEAQQITGIVRLWVGDRLVYDATGTSLDSTIASLQGNLANIMISASLSTKEQGGGDTLSPGGVSWKLYDGSDTQQPDPRMQADKGAANVSAYPGRAYIVFYDLDLTEHYNDTLMSAQVKAEVVCDGTLTWQTDDVFTRLDYNTGLYGTRFRTTFIRLTQTGCKYVVWQEANWDGHPESLNIRNAEFPYLDEEVSSTPSLWDLGWGYTYRAYFVTQSDAEYVLTSQIQYNGVYNPWYRLIGPDGVIESTDGYLSDQTTWEGGGYVVFDRGSIYLFGDSGKLQKISISLGVVMATAAYPYPGWVAASEGHLFIVTNTNATPHVRKISRASFSETADYTMPAAINSLFVLDDDTFYTLDANGTARKFVNGTEAAVFTSAFPAGQQYQFVVSSEEPFSGVAVRFNIGTNTWKWALAHNTLQATSAKLRDIVTYECSLVGLDAGDLDLAELTNSDVKGYRLAGVMSPRAALEPLQAAWPFDVFQKGYKIGFKSRGSASVVTIPEADLGTVAGGEDSAVLLTVTLEMETQIARTVTIKYLDPTRDYEIDEQTSPERPGVSSVSPRELELPISMISGEAMQAADVLNMKEWTERVSLGPFTLPPTYLNLVPSDVVTINHRNRSWQARITRIEYLPDGRLTCSAVQTASSSYSSTAAGSDPFVLGQSLVPLYGSSRVVLLDIPRILSAQDLPGVSAVMYGFTTAWPGGILVRSDDQGQTWQIAQGFNTKARVFTATEAASAAASYSIDHATALTLTPVHDAADLYSITEEQLYAHKNIAAYGVDGRWEIVAFKTATDNSGTYTVKDFLRGMYGTEWATGLHAAGDMVVMLDESSAAFIGLPTTSINSTRLYRAITQGASINSAADISDVYEGNNLKPLSPVDLNGGRDSLTGDWTLTAERRTRWPIELFSGNVVPLGETTESWVWQIWDSGYATLVRVLTSTTGTVEYTGAQQATDFGCNQQTLYLKIQMLSSVVGVGNVLQESITRTISDDQYSAYVTSLIHFNGPDGSTSISDVTGNVWTCSGGAQLSTTTPLYGTASALFNGISSLIYGNNSSGFAYGIGDFAIDIAFKLAALGTWQILLDYRPNSSNGAYPALCVTDANVLGYYCNTAMQITGSTTLTTGATYRARLARVSGITRLFLGGVQEGASWTDSSNMDVGADRPLFGRNGYSAINYLNGMIDEFRSTKGYGRSSSNYTVETGEFPDL